MTCKTVLNGMPGIEKTGDVHYACREGGQASLIVMLVLVCLAVGVVISTAGSIKAAAMVGGLVVFAIAFISTEAALYILIFSMLLSPEIILGKTSAATLGRGVTLRLDDFLLVVIGFGWFVRVAMYKELGLFVRTPISRQIYAYILVTVVATAIGTMAGRVELKTGFFFVLKYFEYFFIYFMVSNMLQSEKQVKNFLIAMFIAAAIVSANGLRQIPEGGRVSAPFEGGAGEPNTFGGYLVLMIALSMAFLLTRGAAPRKVKLPMVIVALMLILTLLFTLSRSSWVAIVPICLFLLFYSDRRKLLAGLLVALIVLGPIFLTDRVKNRIYSTFSKHPSSVYIGTVALDSSTSERLKTWGESFRALMKKPILGYGVTGYKFIDAQYFKVLVETGLVGIMVFIWLLASLLNFGMKHYRSERQPFPRALYLGFTAGTIGMMVHSMGANTFIIVRIMEPFWFLAAMVMSLPRLRETISGATVVRAGRERLLARGA